MNFPQKVTVDQKCKLEGKKLMEQNGGEQKKEEQI
jgi:hypothetical protein